MLNDLKVNVIMLHVCKHGHGLSNNVYEYDVNRLTNEKVIRGKRNVKANPPAQPPGRIHQSIS